MLEFIGIMTVIYLLLMGLVRLFGGKQPQREIYIIREYEILEDTDESVSEEPLSGEKEPHPPGGKPPDNVVPIRRKT
jgi:hypothetical protein